ncbi:MAG: hypothetical protein HC845_05335, partial [Akkermansiaceae bacterium]|nr:hypothetical protein [Akkermansiaceae bacterium]
MNAKNILISSLVGSLIVSGSAMAQQGSAGSGCGGYLSLSGAAGEGTVNLSSAGGGEATEDLAGLRVDAGFIFGSGFSIDGRYQWLQDDADADFTSLRGLVHYKQSLNEVFAAFCGVGYEIKMLDLGVGEIDNDAVLADIGIEFTKNQFFGALSYTHGFTVSSELSGSGGSVDLPKENLGTIELMLGCEVAAPLAIITS